MKTKYIYTGPPSGINIGGEDVPLSPGKEVGLPSSNAYVKGLTARGHLKPTHNEKPEKQGQGSQEPAEPKKGVKK